ncbi:MAG TPA: DUF4259 domain-containing protein [Micromonosporaceae bacterium]
MGAWGSGPFDNDVAWDLVASLEASGPAGWASGIRRAVETAADKGGYLDYDDGSAAVAAAAMLALSRGPVEGLSELNLPHIPDVGELRSPDLRQLAVRALDRVVGKDSEWRGLWDDSAERDDALAAVTRIRSALAEG